VNERIDQLWGQALDQAVPETYSRLSYSQVLKIKQVFAELIVRECINIVDEQKECLHEEQKYWHDRDYGYALAVDDASKGIKQFFGVEE
jgi:hypothetical protein